MIRALEGETTAASWRIDFAPVPVFVCCGPSGGFSPPGTTANPEVSPAVRASRDQRGE